MVKTYTHAKGQGHRSVSLKEWKRTDGQMNGRADRQTDGRARRLHYHPCCQNR